MANDELIKKQIVDFAFHNDQIDASDVHVTVHEGNVSLKGKVPTYNAYRTLYNYANSLNEAGKVKASMTVDYAEKQPKDEEIVNFISNAFKWDAHLKSSDINIRSNDGTVTLSGPVDAYWKKHWAEERASTILGVKNIKNELGIVHSDSVTDEMISQNIINRLKSNMYVKVKNVNVNVEKGNVQLTGKVNSWGERYEAYKCALYTNGVKDIKNSITVED
ncbi:MAG: BON domain-containing protein [Candidatus Thermoplasmatota archaeon]|nr:BON domain-containing protein [Candidatus Thermoplasmatota archaeon]